MHLGMSGSFRIEAQAWAQTPGVFHHPRGKDAAHDHVAFAFAMARRAQRAWAARSPRERARVLLRFHDLVLERQAQLLDITQIETGKARRDAYACDITYATNKQLAFDFLRDRMTFAARRGDLQLRFEAIVRPDARADRLLMRGLGFALIDEADSVLIDEAGSPLVISTSAPGGATPKQIGFLKSLARGKAWDDFQLLEFIHKTLGVDDVVVETLSSGQCRVLIDRMKA